MSMEGFEPPNLHFRRAACYPVTPHAREIFDYRERHIAMALLTRALLVAPLHVTSLQIRRRERDLNPRRIVKSVSS